MLVTLDEMKVYLNIPLSDTSKDVFLSSQIQLAQEAIEAYCERKFEMATYIETFYPEAFQRGHRGFYLYQYPVLSVTSITSDGEVVATADYRVHKPTGQVMHLEGSFWPSESTVVEYIAGFIPVPGVIKSVVFSIVQERYNRQSAGVALSFGSDVQRVSIPGAISIDFDYTLTNSERGTAFGSILGNYLNLLDYYRSDRAVINSGNITYVE